MTLARILLLALAALRATRFVTSDKLGEWWLVGPAKLWAHGYESGDAGHEAIETAKRQGWAVPTPDARQGWRSKLVTGLDCPFCVGFWLGALVLLADVVTRRVRPLRALWTFAAGALALNYVTGHVSSRLDG